MNATVSTSMAYKHLRLASLNKRLDLYVTQLVAANKNAGLFVAFSNALSVREIRGDAQDGGE